MRFWLMILLFLSSARQSSLFPPQFHQFRTLYERRVTSDLTLSIVLADPQNVQSWTRDGVVGIFLRDESGRASTITVIRNPRMECNVEVEHADLNSIVLSRTESDYGVLAPSMKIFLDPATRRVIRTTDYWPAGVGR